MRATERHLVELTLRAFRGTELFGEDPGLSSKLKSMVGSSAGGGVLQSLRPKMTRRKRPVRFLDEETGRCIEGLVKVLQAI